MQLSLRHFLLSSGVVLFYCICAGSTPVVAYSQEQVQEEYFFNPYLYSTCFMTVFVPALSIGGGYDIRLKNFIDAYHRPPEWENDSYVWNFVLHPLWGSETYLRAREARFGVMNSIIFSMGASAAWEYLFESWIKHPSAQDLIFTTGVGWLLGEFRYTLKQKLGERQGWWIDPIHTALSHIAVTISKSREGTRSMKAEVSVGL